MRRRSLLLLLLFGAVGVSAQYSLPSDVTPLLLPDLGHPNHPIATKNAEAQSTSIKVCNSRLVSIVPKPGAPSAALPSSIRTPPCHIVGMALAHGRHMNMDQDMDVSPSEACGAVQQALELSSAAPPKEREYIQALAERCAHGENINWKERDEASVSWLSPSVQRRVAHPFAPFAKGGSVLALLDPLYRSKDCFLSGMPL